jgi:adenylate cyclase
MNYEELKSLLTEAEELNNKGNFIEAETLANELLEKLEKISDSTDTARQGDELRCGALIALSASKWRRGDYATALTLARTALDLVEAKNLAGETNAKALGNIGLLYQYLSDYQQALSYCQKALAIFEEIGSKEGIARNLSNIGLVYWNLSDYAQALSYLQKALAINEEIGNKNGIAINLGNIGNVYWHLSDYAQALTYQQKALAINEEIGNKNGIAVNLGNIGTVYQDLSDYTQALSYYQKALSINEEMGSKYSMARILGNIGQLHAIKEFDGYDADKAEEYLHRAIVLFEDIGEKRNLYELHQALAELYETQERWKEHSIQFKKYHSLEKEVQSEETKKQAGLMEQRRLADEREKEIEIAKAAEAAKLNATSTLLHRVLPESISTRMLEGEENISDFFPSISILFADIQGFTAISANMKAIDVVRFLNFVFGEFDRIMKVHGCEKIKTIGDGYMAVAGAPIECEDHAERLAAAALEMQETINLPEDIRSTMPVGARFGIRIGLHTGSVVAGVIGQERFVYDIHSDAVNLASRMESSGEVDRVHVSSDFVEHLQARYKQTKNTKHSIRFEDRGETNIKGKGMMKTYFLEKSN